MAAVEAQTRSPLREYLTAISLFSRNARLYMVHIVGMDLIHGTWEVLFNLYLLALFSSGSAAHGLGSAGDHAHGIVPVFGFDLHPVGVLVGMAVLSLFSIGVGALSFALALVSKDQEWLFWTVQQTLIFPVLLLAGVLLPLEGAPGWLSTASDLNPLKYVVEAERALFAGEFPVDTVTYGFLGAAVVAALGLVVGLRAMNRSA